MNERLLRFKLMTDSPGELHGRFYPTGETVLNSTEWWGKEPRSCAVVDFKASYTQGDPPPYPANIVVAYRPKGFVNYQGSTRYDGWTAMMPNRKSDGTYLDESGNPLEYGEARFFKPTEVYRDIEFNEIDFGDFVGETDGATIEHLTSDGLMERMRHVRKIGGDDFIAPRRQRSRTKIILSDMPTAVMPDQFGGYVINLNNNSPQLEQVLQDKIEEVFTGYLEGRTHIKTITLDDLSFVELADILVDCTLNQYGMPSYFEDFKNFVPANFMDDLAKRIMAMYEVDVTVVNGNKPGFLLKRPAKKA